MSVANPDALIFKLTAIYALMTHVVNWIDNFATLHHEFRNNSLYLPTLVEQIVTQFACAERSKVFACFGQVFAEKFDDYSLLLKARLSRLPNLNIHPALNVLLIEGRHRSKPINQLNSFIGVETGFLLEGGTEVRFHFVLLFLDLSPN